MMRIKGLAKAVPVSNNVKDLMGSIIDRDPMNTPCWICDKPRAASQNAEAAFYSFWEQCKNGFACDYRYKYREVFFDRPHVIIFANGWPDFKLLSLDRWRLFEIIDRLLIPRTIAEASQTEWSTLNPAPTVVGFGEFNTHVLERQTLVPNVTESSPYVPLSQRFDPVSRPLDYVPPPFEHSLLSQDEMAFDEVHGFSQASIYSPIRSRSRSRSR